MRQMTVEDGNNACEPSSVMPVIDPESEDLPPNDIPSSSSAGNSSSSGSNNNSGGSGGGIVPPPGFPGLRISRQVTVDNGDNRDNDASATAASDQLPDNDGRTAAPVAAIGGGGLLRLRRHVTVAGASGEPTSDDPHGVVVDPHSDELPSIIAAPPGMSLGGAGSPLFARQDTVGQSDAPSNPSSHVIDPDSEELPPQPSSSSSSSSSGGLLAPPGFPGLRIQRQITVEHPSGDDVGSSSNHTHDPSSDDLPPQSSPISQPLPTTTTTTKGADTAASSGGSGGLRLMRHVTVADASGRSSSDDPVGGH
jgi:hypothetical protein